MGKDEKSVSVVILMLREGGKAKNRAQDSKAENT